MKKILKNYRYYVLTVVLAIAVIGIMAVPNDDLNLLNWLYVLVSTKAIGLLAGCLANYLVKRWEKQGTIPELTDVVNNF